MLRRLSEIYGVPFSDNVGKSVIASFAGSIIPASTATTAAMGVGSLVKGLPGIGTAIGAITMPVISAGATYIIGKVFIQHFASGGTLLDFNPPDYREFIKAQKEKLTGRSAAAPPAGSSTPSPTPLCYYPLRAACFDEGGRDRARDRDRVRLRACPPGDDLDQSVRAAVERETWLDDSGRSYRLCHILPPYRTLRHSTSHGISRHIHTCASCHSDTGAARIVVDRSIAPIRSGSPAAQLSSTVCSRARSSTHSLVSRPGERN